MISPKGSHGKDWTGWGIIFWLVVCVTAWIWAGGVRISTPWG